MRASKVVVSLFVVFIAFSFLSLWADEDSRDSESAFGVLAFLALNHSWNTHQYDTLEKIEQAATLMQEAGIGFVRIDFLWLDLEPEQGIFDFSRYDKIVDILNKHNIKILGILEYNPSWRQGPWNQPPDLELYNKFVRRVVEHFKDRVKYWEIWNEPDSNFYWTPQDEMKTYTELLKNTYPAIKAIDPTSKVLIGGLSKMPNISLKRVYQQGGKDFFDIVNIHPFVDPLTNEPINTVRAIYLSVRKIMTQYGDQEKSIWFTEIGCPGVESSNPENNWWNGVSPTEQQQATWVQQLYSQCLGWEGVEKIFWAFFRDTNKHFKSGVDYFGLIRHDFSQKPSFFAYKDLQK